MTGRVTRAEMLPWRPRVIRGAVAALGIFGILAFVLSLPIYLEVHSEVCESGCAPGAPSAATIDRLASFGLVPQHYALIGLGFAVVFAWTCFSVGFLLLRRAGSHDVAVASAAALFVLGVEFPQTFSTLAAVWPLAGPLSVAVDTVSFVAVFAWLISFPTGRFRARASVAVLAAVAAAGVLVAVQPGLIAACALAVALVAVIVDVIVRIVQSSPSDRRGIRSVLIAFAVAIAALAFAGLAQTTFAEPGSLADLLVQSVLVAAFLAIPVVVAHAVLARGLWDPHSSIVQALAAAVTLLVGVVFFAVAFVVLVVAGVDPVVSAIMPLTAAALAGHTVFQRVRRTIARWTHGGAVEPAAILEDLANRLDLVLSPDDVVEVVEVAIASAFHVRSVRIELSPTVGPETRVALVHAGQAVGELVLDTEGRSLDSEVLEALEPVAAYLAAALHAASLDAHLRAAHAQLISAREDERRRMRDELHDQLGPTLASVVLRLGAAENEVAADPEGARQLVAGARSDVTATVAAVRRLVYGLRPAVLDELGLVEATSTFIRNVRGGGMEISLDAPSGPIALPAAVEVAAYRVAMEAITNALRHSGGTRCSVTISANETECTVSIADDGRGLPAELPTGTVGLASMRERTQELGGTFAVGHSAPRGVRVQASFPLARGE